MANLTLQRIRHCCRYLIEPHRTLSSIPRTPLKLTSRLLAITGPDEVIADVSWGSDEEVPDPQFRFRRFRSSAGFKDEITYETGKDGSEQKVVISMCTFCTSHFLRPWLSKSVLTDVGSVFLGAVDTTSVDSSC